MMLFPDANNWRSSMQDVSAAIDDTMAEPVTVTPFTADPRPNFPAVPDPSRAIITRAVFTSKAETVLMGDGKQYGGHSISPLISTSKPVFSFDYRAVPWPLRQGYRIMLHRTGELFEVRDVRPDGVSRIIGLVAQLGRQSEAR